MIKNNILGGLKSKFKPGFDNVLDMLKSKSAKISCLSYDSLYGFILRLDVDETDSKYQNLDSHNDFSEPQTNFIIKLSLVHADHDTSLPIAFKYSDKDGKEMEKNKLTNEVKTQKNGKEMEKIKRSNEVKIQKNGKEMEKFKRSSLKKDFLDEAKVQMDIYAKSIVGGREPICPGIADVQILNNDERNIINFLRLLHEKATDEITIKIITYIKRLCLKPIDVMYDKIKKKSKLLTFELGVITMDIFKDSITLKDYTKKNNNNPNNYNIDIFVNAITQVILLTFTCHYVHHDLHMGNVLVCESTNKTLLIDFGRVSYLKGSDTKFLKDYSKSKYDKLKLYFSPYEPEYRRTVALLGSDGIVTDDFAKKGISVKAINNEIDFYKRSLKYLFTTKIVKLGRMQKWEIINNILRYLLLIDSSVMYLSYGQVMFRVQMRWIVTATPWNTKTGVHDTMLMIFNNLESVYTPKDLTNVDYNNKYITSYSSVKDSEMMGSLDPSKFKFNKTVRLSDTKPSRSTKSRPKTSRSKTLKFNSRKIKTV